MTFPDLRIPCIFLISTKFLPSLFYNLLTQLSKWFKKPVQHTGRATITRQGCDAVFWGAPFSSTAALTPLPRFTAASQESLASVLHLPATSSLNDVFIKQGLLKGEQEQIYLGMAFWVWQSPGHLLLPPEKPGKRC